MATSAAGSSAVRDAITYAVTPSPIAATANKPTMSPVRRVRACVSGATAVDLNSPGVRCFNVSRWPRLDGPMMRGRPLVDSGVQCEVGRLDAACASACAIAVAD